MPEHNNHLNYLLCCGVALYNRAVGIALYCSITVTGVMGYTLSDYPLAGFVVTASI